MHKVNVLRKCGHLETFAMSLGVTGVQIEKQRQKQQEKLCLICLTTNLHREIEQHRKGIIQ